VSEIEIGRGVLAPSADVTGAAVPEDECFLCTAPEAHSKKDCENAWTVGLLAGMLLMAGHGEQRPALCAAHETKLREVLAVYCKDKDIYDRLGIETRYLEAGEKVEKAR
jgi:hypothetical protein